MSRVTISYPATIAVDINIEDIRKYLMSKGWSDIGKCGEFGQEFKNDRHRTAVILPTVDTAVDFDKKMSDLFRVMSFVEKRQIPDIIKDIQKTKIILPVEIKIGLICLALSAVAVGIIAFYLLIPF